MIRRLLGTNLDILDLLLTYLITFTTFISPIKGLIGMLFIAILMDTFVAIYVVLRTKDIRFFTSHKLFNIVPKSILYFTAIIVFYMSDHYIFDNEIFGIEHLLTKLITILWIYIEIKSMDESLIKLGRRSIWVTVKSMIRKIKSLKHDISEIIDPNLDEKDQDDSYDNNPSHYGND